MATRKALGRGLSALIPEPTTARRPRAPEPAPDETLATPFHVPVERLVPNPLQPRKTFDDADLNSLAGSIREQGILQPLVIRRRGDAYELIIGERRWRAAQLAGLQEVPAVVLDATDRAVVEMALVENVQRADLNPMELAEAFRVLVETEGMTQEEAGRRVGLDRSSVANHLRLLELPRDIQEDLIEGRLTMGHARAILQAPQDRRPTVRDQVLRGALSVRATEEISRRAAASSASKPSRPGPKRDVHVVDLEDRLRRALQTRVRVVGRRERGRIELHYFGDAELTRLSDRLLGSDA
jgi:ParB family chromosome partitioning protein